MIGHVVLFVLGCALIFKALVSAVRTFVVPRGGSPDSLTRGAFVVMRALMEQPFRRSSHVRREAALAYFAPLALLTLPVAWLACVLLGYSAIYWALGSSSWTSAIDTSRLSLLYLGSNI